MAFPYSSGDVLTAADLNQSSGLVLVKTQAIGSAVSSVTVSDAFSSTFDNYLITIQIENSSSLGPYLTLALGASTTGYYYGAVLSRYSDGNVVGTNTNNGSKWDRLGPLSSSLGGAHTYKVLQPYLTEATFIEGSYTDPSTGGRGGGGSGFHNSATSYSSFIVGVSVGTITGGTIRVYGYNNG
jgi:hypothetical protein